MMNRKNVSLLMVLCMVTGSMAGCDESIDQDSVLEAEALDDSETIRGHEILSIVELEEGGTLEFGRMDSGGIVVIEKTPVGALSPIDTLMTAQDATPLEVYLAVAPPEREIPAALIETHERFAIESGRSIEARALPFEPLDPSFRANYDWYYAADCSLSADGNWFDNFWDVNNWNWHWYYRGSAANKESAFAAATVSVQAHLCNDGPSNNINFWVVRWGCLGNWHNVHWKFDVASDYRAQFRAWQDSSECGYTTRVDPDDYGSPSPTYSLGLTKP